MIAISFQVYCNSQDLSVQRETFYIPSGQPGLYNIFLSLIISVCNQVLETQKKPLNVITLGET
jgi:hypothetical protein